jgi:hypothetical protein
MTECDEVATSLSVNLTAILTPDGARWIVRAHMSNESVQIVNNVAKALFARAVQFATKNATKNDTDASMAIAMAMHERQAR